MGKKGRNSKKRSHFRSRNGSVRIPAGARSRGRRSRNVNPSLIGIDLVDLARCMQREKKRSA